MALIFFIHFRQEQVPKNVFADPGSKPNICSIKSVFTDVGRWTLDLRSM
jgi:hypothetical protein